MTTQYQLKIEAPGGTLTPERIDQLMSDLADYGPSLSERHGLIAIRITVPADSVRQATATGITVVEQAIGAPAVAVEALTEEEYEAREGFESILDIISVEAAAALIGRSVQRVRQMIDEGKLRAERIGSRTYVLSRREVLYRFGEETRGGGTPVTRVMSRLQGRTQFDGFSTHELITIRDILSAGLESHSGIAEYDHYDLLGAFDRVASEINLRATSGTI